MMEKSTRQMWVNFIEKSPCPFKLLPCIFFFSLLPFMCLIKQFPYLDLKWDKGLYKKHLLYICPVCDYSYGMVCNISLQMYDHQHISNMFYNLCRRVRNFLSRVVGKDLWKYNRNKIPGNIVSQAVRYGYSFFAKGFSFAYLFQDQSQA